MLIFLEKIFENAAENPTIIPFLFFYFANGNSTQGAPRAEQRSRPLQCRVRRRSILNPSTDELERIAEVQHD